MTLDISYKVVGEGDPIIFIHGIGSRKYSWKGIIDELKEKFLCIIYDLRGHGDSKFNSSDFNLNDLVEDIEKLRSHLDIYKMHLVGHSLGGMIGPAYTKKYPNKVISTTLLSTAAFRSVNDQQKLLNIINLIENEGLNKVIPNLINRWFTDLFIQQNPNIINKRIEQIKNTPISVFLNVFRIYALTEMSAWLASIKTPCLIMTGEHDTSCNPEINKKIAKIIPNSKLEILKNLKHAITLESPQLIGKKISNFLNNL